MGRVHCRCAERSRASARKRRRRLEWTDMMRKATRTIAAWFGITAGIAGLEHGYFEILQGKTLGVQCQAREVHDAARVARCCARVTSHSTRSTLDRARGAAFSRRRAGREVAKVRTRLEVRGGARAHGPRPGYCGGRLAPSCRGEGGPSDRPAGQDGLPSFSRRGGPTAGRLKT